jgi:hypothetical protein
VPMMSGKATFTVELAKIAVMPPSIQVTIASHL